MSFNIN